MYRVTYYQIGGGRKVVNISEEQDLTKAVQMSLAFFEVMKIFSLKPLEARSRVVPDGASVEIFATNVNIYRNDSSQFIGMFRCQELPDGESE